MDKLFELLVPKLPVWAITPTLVLVIFILVWPSLREITREIIPSYRSYSREKMRLELLKLNYEIEALRKQHDLPELKGILPKRFSLSQTKQDQPIQALVTERAISRLSAWAAGALGGAAVALVPLIYLLPEPEVFTSAYVVGLTIRIFLLATIGGVTSVMRRSKSLFDALINGMLVPALIALSLAVVPAGNFPRV